MRKSIDFVWKTSITLEFPKNKSGYSAYVWISDNYYQVTTYASNFAINKIFSGGSSITSQYVTDYSGTNLKVTFSLTNSATFIGNVEWVNSNWNVY